MVSVAADVRIRPGESQRLTTHLRFLCNSQHLPDVRPNFVVLAPDLRPSTRNHIVCPRFKPPAKLLVEGAVETKHLRDGKGRLPVEINGVESIYELVH